MKKFIMPIIFLIQGCATSSLLNFEKKSDFQKSVDEFLSQSNITVVDEQMLSHSRQMNTDDLFRDRLVNVNQSKKRDIKIYLKPCSIVAPFYRNPKSLISLLTFTIVPFGNVYECVTEIESIDHDSKKSRTYSVSQRYAVAYGIVNAFGPAYFDGSFVLYEKKTPIFVGIAEAAKDE